MIKPINSPEYDDVVAVLVDGKRILDPATIDEEKGEVTCWLPTPTESVEEGPAEIFNATQEELEASAEWSTKTLTGKITLVRKK